MPEALQARIKLETVQSAKRPYLTCLEFRTSGGQTTVKREMDILDRRILSMERMTLLE